MADNQEDTPQSISGAEEDKIASDNMEDAPQKSVTGAEEDKAMADKKTDTPQKSISSAEEDKTTTDNVDTTSQKRVSSDGFAVPSGLAPRPHAASSPSQPQKPPPPAPNAIAEFAPPPPPPPKFAPPPPPPKTSHAVPKAAAAPKAAPAPKPTPPQKSGSSGARPPSVGSAAAYRPPRWSGPPPEPYSLEVLRGGQIIDTVQLQDRAHVLFGRLPDCDVRLEHPSISRYHAALVYRATADEEHEAGYYLYDLGSTHGSSLNKNPIRPNVYCRMRVGHMCKFGGSTRMYILQGPEEDRESESEMTVTELKELGQRRQELQQERLQKEQERLAQLEKEKLGEDKIDDDEEEEKKPQKRPEAKAAGPETSADDGISWGMGEDADEETDLQFNPFALGEAENEQLYLVDPKKTLRGWFEREGHELEYQTEELPGGRHVCRVTLPLEPTGGGAPPVAEASHVGKKKEAVFQCALEACRMLDRAGVLRQSKQESRKVKRRKQTGYDSDDDDTFLDRTGAVERKRQRRQQQAGGAEPKADTYQSLLAQYQKAESEAEAVERRLQQAEAASAAQSAASASADGDELDAFMTRLSAGAIGDRQERRQMRGKLTQLRAEQARLGRLVNLARPAALPPLKLPTQAASARSPLTGFIGRRRGKGAPTAAGQQRGQSGTATHSERSVRSAAPPPAEEESEEDEKEESEEASVVEAETKREVPRGSDVPSGSPAPAQLPSRKDIPTSTSATAAEEASDMDTDTGSERVSGSGKTTNGGTRLPGDAASQKDASSQEAAADDRTDRLTDSDRLSPLVEPAAPADGGMSPPKSPQQPRPQEPAAPKPNKPPRQKRNRKQAAAAPQYAELAGDGSYDVWVPPAGQTGDGRTSLNDKLGY